MTPNQKWMIEECSRIIEERANYLSEEGADTNHVETLYNVASGLAELLSEEPTEQEKQAGYEKMRHWHEG
jgi:hypothetical protein